METLNWNNYIEIYLRLNFIEEIILSDKSLMEYLSLLPPNELEIVLLGRYYISDLPHKLIPITEENKYLLINTFLSIITTTNDKHFTKTKGN